MDASEIYNLNIHELVTTTFAIDWSPDNHISVITERGVHIFEPQPNPLCAYPSAKFKRSFIYPSDELPSAPFIPILNSLILNFDREDLYLSMFEEALTPKLPEKTDHIPRIIATSWSPIELVQPAKCLLAILTSIGAIDLAFQVGKSWFSICNISSVWWEIVKEELDFNPVNIDVMSVDAATFRNNVRRLQGTAITWSPLKQQACSPVFAYFVTTFRSCDLVIWKINRIPELGMKVEPTIVYRSHFDVDAKISQLLWIDLDASKYLIVIAFADGRIYGLQVRQNNEKLVEETLEKYQANPDRMAVSGLKELSRNSDEINIIITKNYFVILITVNRDGVFLRQQHIQLSGYYISGLILIDDDKAIVSTQDSRLYALTMNDGLNLTWKPVNHDMKKSTVQYLGLARSPSGATFINITTPNCLYDHLINREPTVIQLFGFKDDKLDPWNILNKVNSTLNTHWDCLESIRIRAAKDVVPENCLPTIPEALESSSIHQLRAIMWLTLITDVLKKKKIIKKIDNIIGEISEAQPLIFVYSASAHIIKLTKRGNLTQDMRRCIHFLRLYLEVFLAGEDDDGNGESAALRHAKTALNLSSKLSLIETEPCNLCGEIVTELPWNTSSCPIGHKLPRCALTLLQITCLKYRSCPVCARIYHPSLDQVYNDVRCVYCDIPAQYDTRLIGVYDEIEEKCKNLSIQPVQEVQSSRSLESETCVVLAQNNKKSRTEEIEAFTSNVTKDD